MVLQGALVQIIRTYQIEDECGNTDFITQNITVNDTIDPVFDKLPDPINDITCSDALPTQEVLTATDNCSGATVSTSVDPYTVDLCAGYAITYIWTATDSCGNATSESITFNVLPDTTSPTANPLPDLGPFACYPDIPAADVNVVTGENDNCGKCYCNIRWG